MHMLNSLWVGAFRWEFAHKALAGAALVGAALATSHASAETRSEPYPAWPEPVIQDKMSVDEAKAIVAERTKPQTEWKGPIDGPKAPSGDFTIAYVSPDQSYTPHVLWGKGVEQGAKALGWKVMTFNGQGTVSGTLAAMQQALASNPAAIITPADANALQKPIKEAVSRHIPVIGIQRRRSRVQAQSSVSTRTSSPIPQRSVEPRWPM
jgi:ribose transport system substrate-binding protein